MLPANQELHVAAKVTLFLKGPNLRTNSQRVGKTLHVKVVSQVKKCVEFPAQFSYFHQFSYAQLTWLPVLVFFYLGVSGKLMMFLRSVTNPVRS
jgi:hypothetical protein